VRTGVGDADPTFVRIPAGRPDQRVGRLGHVAGSALLVAFGAGQDGLGRRQPGDRDTER
jgi:hypothetical protein